MDPNIDVAFIAAGQDAVIFAAAMDTNSMPTLNASTAVRAMVGGIVYDCIHCNGKGYIRIIPNIQGTFEEGIVGIPYFNDSVYATNEVGPYSWTYTGTIPPGLELEINNTSKERLYHFYMSGTPTEAGIYNFTITVSDNGNDTATKDFSVHIHNMLIKDSIETGRIGLSYSADLRLEGGIAPFTAQVVSGNLPPGLALMATDSEDRFMISGIPEHDGIYKFTVEFTDTEGKAESADLAITIHPIAVEVSADSAERVGTPYSGILSPTGGTVPFSWNVIRGFLPPGLSLKASGDEVVIDGTPTKEGTYAFTVEIADSKGNKTEKNISISVNTLCIEGNLKADENNNQCISGSVKATYGNAPYSWTVIGGFLPPGIVLAASGDKAELSGYSVSADTYNFTLQVTDAAGNKAEKDFTVSVGGVDYNGMYISEAQRSSHSSFDNYYFDFIGGRPPYKWSIAAGGIPYDFKAESYTAGVKVWGFKSVFSLEAYLYHRNNTFVLKAVDADGRYAYKKYNIVINDSNVTQVGLTMDDVQIPDNDPIISSNIPDAYEGEPYSAVIKVLNGDAPCTWSADIYGLPEGLSLSFSDSETNPGSGLTGRYAHITGTPKEGGCYGAFTLKVKDANDNTDARLFSFKVVQKPSVAGIFPDAVAGAEYTAFIRGLGGLQSESRPYKWDVNCDNYPEGLSFVESGDKVVISGTPSEAGEYTLKASVTDSENHESAARTFVLTVTKTKVYSNIPSLAEINDSFREKLWAETGTAPYS